jgi:hypothetical protein
MRRTVFILGAGSSAVFGFQLAKPFAKPFAAATAAFRVLAVNNSAIAQASGKMRLGGFAMNSSCLRSLLLMRS